MFDTVNTTLENGSDIIVAGRRMIASITMMTINIFFDTPSATPFGFEPIKHQSPLPEKIHHRHLVFA
jgi:hypothetical protein